MSVEAGWFAGWHDTNPRNERPKMPGKPGLRPDSPGPARAFARRAEPLDLIYLKSNGIPNALGLCWVQGKALLLPGFMGHGFRGLA